MNSITIIGHSGATGYNTDPHDPSRNATENSWATGTNPAVNSIYLRLLARNPAIRGHNVNLAQDGATVEDLLRQAQLLVTENPLPNLVIIQSVDNDIRCDGSDPQNYQPFAATLSHVLTTIATQDPGAHILIVSSPWGSDVARAARLIVNIPAARAAANAPGTPCEMFDRSGRIEPAGAAYLTDVIQHYEALLESACVQVATCQYDHGAYGNMLITPADMSPDYNHLSIRGQAKAAATVWAVIR